MIEDVARIHLLAGSDAEVTLITTSLLENSAGEEPALAALRIRNGQLLLKDGVVLPIVGGRTAVADFLDHDGLKSPAILQTPLHESGTLHDGLFVSGHQNYYHFLVYFLPGLLFLKALAPAPGQALSLYMHGGVPPSVAGFFPHLLAALGGAVTATRLPEGVFKVTNVLFPALPKLFTPALVCRRVVAPLVMRLAEAGALPRERGPLKLFVRRDNAPGGRNLANQQEVEEWFRARGYVSVDPGALPFEEQVLLFARATHIAGVEGAAMANILFAADAQEVLLIASPAVQRYALFEPLLKQYKTAFRILYGERMEGEPNTRKANFRLPLSTLAAEVPGS